MRAWQLTRLGGDLSLIEKPIPEARPGTVVLRLEASVLMSYLQRYVDGELPFYAPPPHPFTIGSNGVFTVHAVGRDVWHLRPGQRVIQASHLVATENVPEPSQLLLGVTAAGGAAAMQADWPDGVLADYAVVPKQLVTPLPDDARSPAQLACASRYAVPFGGWTRGRLAAGETVLVTGASGAYGSAAVLLALALGAGRVVAAARNTAALARLARPRVVPVALTGDRAADTAAIRDAAGGGVDLALDFVGGARDTAATLAGLHALRRNGRLVLMGSAFAPLEIDYLQLLMNNWEILGQFMFPADTYRRIFGLVGAGLLDLDAIVPRTFPLADLPRAMTAAAQAAGHECVVIVP